MITGREEAELSFAGAVGTLDGVDEPVLLVDLGGGSTELVLGGADPPAGAQHGRRLGADDRTAPARRPADRRRRSRPRWPTSAPRSTHAARDVPLDDRAPRFVGVAGTVTTVAAIALGLTDYDPARIHGMRLSREQIADVTDRLLGLDHAARAAMPVMHPGRVDVIGGGAVVLRTVVERDRRRRGRRQRTRHPRRHRRVDHGVVEDGTVTAIDGTWAACSGRLRPNNTRRITQGASNDSGRSLNPATRRNLSDRAESVRALRVSRSR